MVLCIVCTYFVNMDHTTHTTITHYGVILHKKSYLESRDIVQFCKILHYSMLCKSTNRRHVLLFMGHKKIRVVSGISKMG